MALSAVELCLKNFEINARNTLNVAKYLITCIIKFSNDKWENQKLQDVGKEIVKINSTLTAVSKDTELFKEELDVSASFLKDRGASGDLLKINGSAFEKERDKMQMTK